jgi:hypothetical protein
MKAVPVPYQSGCLTIGDYEGKLEAFTLDYPNTEVRVCFAKSLFEHGLQPSDF